MWNGSTLYGGMSVADAIASLSGGWEPVANWEQWAPENLIGNIEWAGLQGVYADVASRYKITPELFRQFADKIYVYDTALMTGNEGVAQAVSKWKNEDPARKKFFSYLRKKIHTYGSSPQKLTRSQKVAIATSNAALRRANRAALARGPWVGSNQYTNNRSRTRGNYKGLFKPARRPAGYNPYTSLGLALRGAAEDPTALPDWNLMVAPQGVIRAAPGTPGTPDATGNMEE